MEKITVRFPRLTQEIHVGDGALSEVVPTLKSLGYDGYLVVIDEGAYRSGKERFGNILSELSIGPERVIRLTPQP
ncbi:MAG TPA: hypothetical protein VNU25_02520, partial [Candidatus Paceibacterota bacterium]|nr:hypothetical protein [Candidatus Paceibacterota bacterium]